MNNKKTALLLVDLQNDFIHPNGAYGRASQFSQDIAVLPQTVAPEIGRASCRERV